MILNCKHGKEIDEAPEEVIKKAKEFVAKELGEEIKKTYSVRTKCGNCGYKDWVFEVEYGKRISDYACPNCGCYDLTRVDIFKISEQ